MADNKFRTYRSNDPTVRDDVGPIEGDLGSDPLAELARLIGQSDPVGEFGRSARQSPAETVGGAMPAAGGLDWAADDGYADPKHHSEDRYAQPQRRDSHPTAPPVLARAVPARAYEEPPISVGRQAPALTPELHNDRYAADDQRYSGADDRSYVAEEQYEDGPGPRRRSGLVTALAVAAVVVLGTAGTFAYRATFGGAIMPSLPPIIKASGGPNKIIPARGDAQANAAGQEGAANAGAGEKLVSREEQPVNIQTPSTAPRVISTIPIVPDQNPAMPGTSGPVSPGPVGGMSLAPTPGPGFPPAPSVMPPNTMPTAAAQTSVLASPAPKKIHTVTIRADQMGAANAAAAPSTPPPAHPVSTRAPAIKPNPAPAPPPKADGRGPLMLVPQVGDARSPAPAPAPQPRVQIARAGAANEPLSLGSGASPSQSAAPLPGGGGYTVQVTSQRSEAEAKAAYRSLRAKFPDQLGRHEPVIRRADLGAKGTYYRALVGPFASMEEASTVCSSLKAAGGNCLVQRD